MECVDRIRNQSWPGGWIAPARTIKALLSISWIKTRPGEQKRSRVIGWCGCDTSSIYRTGHCQSDFSFITVVRIHATTLHVIATESGMSVKYNDSNPIDKINIMHWYDNMCDKWYDFQSYEKILINRYKYISIYYVYTFEKSVLACQPSRARLFVRTWRIPGKIVKTLVL